MALLMADPARYAPDLLGFYPQERQIDRRYEVTGINPYSVDESTRKVNALLPISYAVPTSRQGSEALMQRLGSIRPAVPSAITDALSNMYELGKYGYGGDTDMTYDEMKERSAQAAMDVAGGGFGSRMFMNPAYDPATVSMSGARSYPSKGYSGSNRQAPFEELQRIVEPAYDVAPIPVREVEGLLGKTIIPFVADKSDAGLYFKGYDDVVFDQPVLLEGGRKFMTGRQAQADDALWASGKSVISGLLNAAKKSKDETGQDVYGAFLTMSPQGVDFSTMMSDSLVEAVKQAKVKKSDIKAIDDEIKAIHPEWVGILSPKAKDFLRNLSGKQRVALIKRFDSSKMKDKGFPDVGSIRYSITDPQLRDVGSYRGGMAFGKIDVDRGVVESPTFGHGSYDTQMAGSGDVFRLEQDIPMSLLFPDRLNEERFINSLPQNRMGSLRDSPYGQSVNEQMIENMINYKMGIL